MRSASAFLCTVLVACARPAIAVSCGDWGTWLSPACRSVVETYGDGKTGVLVSGYAWHLPFTWTPERRAQLNAEAWGGGIIRTAEDPDGDTHSLFAMAFRDSHYHVQWNIGYEHSTYWGPRSGLQPGIGYTALIVKRPDIAQGVPFPAVLPLLSLRYGDATLFTTYIPTLNGGINHGSTVYVFGRILID